MCVLIEGHVGVDSCDGADTGGEGGAFGAVEGGQEG